MAQILRCRLLRDFLIAAVVLFSQLAGAAGPVSAPNRAGPAINFLLLSDDDYTLSVSKTGSGTVTSAPAGINCGAICTKNYNSGTVVTLTATPLAGSTFSSWGGACTGTSGCNVTMNAAKSVSATFTLTSSFPSNPISSGSYSKNNPFTLNDGTTTSYIDVPTAYDETHNTPIKLFVWLHGCGGFASGDIWSVSPGGAQSWISIAVGGTEGGCWNVTSDPARVMTAVAYMKTRFNIDPGKVILGGYSSGGDLAYRTFFYNSNTFAGCVIENSSPFRDTGSSQAQSFAAVNAGGWKFNVVHLAHLQDTTYPIAGVRTETNAMINAGFPLSRIEVDGGHYDDPGAIENGHAVPGTTADLITILLPHINDGWVSPGGAN